MRINIILLENSEDLEMSWMYKRKVGVLIKKDIFSQ
ncbi:hypothetical protein IGI57_002106 [Enterococcus sp. DIV0213j]|jgi:hypothetical protein